MSETVTPETVAAEPTSEQAALIARVRRMMLIAGLTTAVGIGALLVAIGYRVFRNDGSVQVTDVTATLPKGARIVSVAPLGERLAVTVEIGGATEIRTYDGKTLKPVGRLRFAAEP